MNRIQLLGMRIKYLAACATRLGQLGSVMTRHKSRSGSARIVPYVSVCIVTSEAMLLC